MPTTTKSIKRSGTKEKILKVSTTLFSELGYKGTSVRKIASNVGIRESAIYNHYKNKEEILSKTIEGYLEFCLKEKSLIRLLHLKLPIKEAKMKDNLEKIKTQINCFFHVR